ncbi:hypothetical protein NSA56_11420 [Oceanobacillus caeni]|uniref:hypothetical protein n=1 Tax=Oceanobacillus caeni TaxID=405946 RepID=UPI00214A6C76|nr:hypothetical protein [Oceanobacillus caeni]MCR1835005.1 hypothetical protein [Oceanobacillus caeni]
MNLQVRDRVTIFDGDGIPLAVGTIVNINNFREPCHKYAVDVDGYTEDVFFFGDKQLVKIEEENK